MKPPIEIIKLSQQSKDKLVRLKRDTGIANWNILCRWALLLALGDGNPPDQAEIKTDSNVEMSWKLFCGEYQHAIEAVFLFRCRLDGVKSSADHAMVFKRYLAKGILMLAAQQERPGISQLVRRASSRSS